MGNDSLVTPVDPASDGEEELLSDLFQSKWHQI